MAELSTSGVVREILTRNPDMSAEDVIREAKAQGLTASDGTIRHSIYNQRNVIRAKAGKTKSAKPAPSVARGTTPPPATAVAEATAVPALDLGTVFANVTLVNKVVGLCGVENARQVAEAVESCGGTAAFLQHLALVADIRAAE